MGLAVEWAYSAPAGSLTLSWYYRPTYRVPAGPGNHKNHDSERLLAVLCQLPIYVFAMAGSAGNAGCV